jgi:hypothetical protein
MRIHMLRNAIGYRAEARSDYMNPSTRVPKR